MDAEVVAFPDVLIYRAGTIWTFRLVTELARDFRTLVDVPKHFEIPGGFYTEHRMGDVIADAMRGAGLNVKFRS